MSKDREDDPFARLRIITMKQVTDLTSYTAQQIYRLIKAGKFPQRVKVGANRVGWREIDVIDWLESRPTFPPASD